MENPLCCGTNKIQIAVVRCDTVHVSMYVDVMYCNFVIVIVTGHVGRGSALVESMPFDRRVVGSNPALAAT